MSPARAAHAPSVAASRALQAAAVRLGTTVRDDRRRRRWSLDELAARAQLSRSAVHAAEAGRPASLDTYVRLAVALNLRPDFVLADPRPARPRGSLEADFVHSAMGEAEASHLVRSGLSVALDEPYQHYQFAGRADLVAWDLERRVLLHLENRTGFPDLQDAAGAFNAKRAFLPAALAERHGIRCWRAVTHVMVVLWSSEVLHALRLRPATFRALCPDPPDRFSAWWNGTPPTTGTTTALVVLDPIAGQRRSRRQYLGLDDAMTAPPRYRGYREAADALRHRDASGLSPR